MYKKIMVPVDLGHTEKLDKALATAADLSKVYEAPVQMVAVTTTAPSAVAHNPEEFARKLADYAAAESARHGVAFAADALTSPDPAVDLDETLGREAHAIGADLIVMASHVPGLTEHVFASRAGYLASHTDISVFVVR
ncbi:universal stress protein [Pelagibius sp.]|uniref:universal stress protein n=1 Tax=Pelagibius sp. TaxID=1931238 RepID=UPI003B502C18